MSGTVRSVWVQLGIAVVGALIAAGVLSSVGGIEGWLTQVSTSQVFGVVAGVLLWVLTFVVVKNFGMVVVEGQRFWSVLYEFVVGAFLLLLTGFFILPNLIPLGLLSGLSLSARSEFNFFEGVSVVLCVMLGIWLSGMIGLLLFLRSRR